MNDKEALEIVLKVATDQWALNTSNHELKIALQIVESLVSIYPGMTLEQLVYVRRHEESLSRTENSAERLVQNNGETRGGPMQSRDLLDDFAQYCADNPSERFWQALRNWSGQAFILAARNGSDESRRNPKDTFYWDARNGFRRSLDAE